MNFSPPTNKLNPTQRKSLGLGPAVKFVRDPAATPSREFVNAAIKQSYRTGDGEQSNYVCR
jgi:hypothetical protein